MCRDRKYAPYCDADHRCETTADLKGQPAERRSLTVRDWLSRPSPEEYVERMKHELGASLDLLDNALQIPKELSPFNGLRTQVVQESAQPEHQDDVDGAARYSELGKYRPASPHRRSDRSAWSEGKVKLHRPPHVTNCKPDYKILNDWRAQHVSLRACIEAKMTDRPRPRSKHSWTLPQKPDVRAIEEPGATWTKLVVSSKLPRVKDNDLELKTELDQSLLDIVHSTAEAENEPEEKWRRSLRFSIFRGGITS